MIDYKEVLKYTEKYAGALRKHIFIVIGTCMYIAFVVMATIFYSPSYYACLNTGGTTWMIVNSIVNALFVVLLIFFVCQGFLPDKDNYLKAFRKVVPKVLFICIVFLILSYGILFFKCRNLTACKNCDETQRTAFNSLVTKQVNQTNFINNLYLYYQKEMTTRFPLSSCSSYYNASYQNNANLNKCNDNKGKKGVCNVSIDPSKGAPILAEFYVMTSSRTCVVNNQYDGYMSAKMIKIALTGGARCLDFDVSALTLSKNPIPIVTVSRDRDNKNLQHNYVTLENCFKTICDNWLTNSDGINQRDPLFIHLNLRPSLTTDCMDTMAHMLNYYFNEYSGGHYLLTPDFHYTNLNLGSVPICLLFDKIIIIVNSQFRKPSTLLDQMINALDGQPGSSYFQEKTWSEIKNTTDAMTTLVEFNRTKLTYVETSFHPYLPISNTFGPTEGGLTSNVDAKYNKNDSLTELIMNKQTINNNPMIPFKYGCQFIAMNFQNLDDDMKTYMSYFKNVSLILKDSFYLRKPLIETGTIVPPFSCGENDFSMITLDTNGNSCTEVCIPQKSVPIFTQNQKTSENLTWNRGTCSRDDYPVMSGEVQVGGSEVVASDSITGVSKVGGLVGRLYTKEEKEEEKEATG